MMSGGGGGSDNGGNSSAKVRVCVRCRPVLGDELMQKKPMKFEKDAVSVGSKTFYFDELLDEASSQEEVYMSCIRDRVDKCFDGFNATIFAYGQTGSGKTYTMMGAVDDDDNRGVTVRALGHLFDRLEDCKIRGDSILSVRVSFLEIYNEECRDLLHSEINPRDIMIREDRDGRIFFTGAREEIINSYDDALYFLEFGMRARTTAETFMNSTSSRSHAIFSVSLELLKYEVSLPADESKVEPVGHMHARGEGSESESGTAKVGVFVQSKLHLVDLAGSERNKRSQTTGVRFKESVGINQGLLALGKVIRALTHPRFTSGTASGTASGGSGKASHSGKNGVHIPYRESKLTRFLQDALGGNSYTVMIACVSPCELDIHESLNTLQYAAKARAVQNEVRANVVTAEAHMAKQADKMQPGSDGDEDGAVTKLVPVTGSDPSVSVVEALREKLRAMEAEMQQMKLRVPAASSALRASWNSGIGNSVDLSGGGHGIGLGLAKPLHSALANTYRDNQSNHIDVMAAEMSSQAKVVAEVMRDLQKAKAVITSMCKEREAGEYKARDTPGDGFDLVDDDGDVVGALHSMTEQQRLRSGCRAVMSILDQCTFSIKRLTSAHTKNIADIKSSQAKASLPVGSAQSFVNLESSASRNSFADVLEYKEREAELETLRTELAECREDLQRDEEIFSDKVRELKSARKMIKQLEDANKSLLNQLEAELSETQKLRLHTGESARAGTGAGYDDGDGGSDDGVSGGVREGVGAVQTVCADADADAKMAEDKASSFGYKSESQDAKRMDSDGSFQHVYEGAPAAAAGSKAASPRDEGKAEDSRAARGPGQPSVAESKASSSSTPSHAVRSDEASTHTPSHTRTTPHTTNFLNPDIYEDSLDVSVAVITAEPDAGKLIEDLEMVCREREQLLQEKLLAEEKCERASADAQQQVGEFRHRQRLVHSRMKALEETIRQKETLISRLEESKAKADALADRYEVQARDLEAQSEQLRKQLNALSECRQKSRSEADEERAKRIEYESRLKIAQDALTSLRVHRRRQMEEEKANSHLEELTRLRSEHSKLSKQVEAEDSKQRKVLESLTQQVAQFRRKAAESSNLIKDLEGKNNELRVRLERVSKTRSGSRMRLQSGGQAGGGALGAADGAWVEAAVGDDVSAYSAATGTSAGTGTGTGVSRSGRVSGRRGSRGHATDNVVHANTATTPSSSRPSSRLRGTGSGSNTSKGGQYANKMNTPSSGAVVAATAGGTTWADVEERLDDLAQAKTAISATAQLKLSRKRLLKEKKDLLAEIAAVEQQSDDRKKAQAIKKKKKNGASGEHTRTASERSAQGLHARVEETKTRMAGLIAGIKRDRARAKDIRVIIEKEAAGSRSSYAPSSSLARLKDELASLQTKTAEAAELVVALEDRLVAQEGVLNKAKTTTDAKDMDTRNDYDLNETGENDFADVDGGSSDDHSTELRLGDLREELETVSTELDLNRLSLLEENKKIRTVQRLCGLPESEEGGGVGMNRNNDVLDLQNDLSDSYRKILRMGVKHMVTKVLSGGGSTSNPNNNPNAAFASAAQGSTPQSVLYRMADKFVEMKSSMADHAASSHQLKALLESKDGEIEALQSQAVKARNDFTKKTEALRREHDDKVSFLLQQLRAAEACASAYTNPVPNPVRNPNSATEASNTGKRSHQSRSPGMMASAEAGVGGALDVPASPHIQSLGLHVEGQLRDRSLPSSPSSHAGVGVRIHASQHTPQRHPRSAGMHMRGSPVSGGVGVNGSVTGSVTSSVTGSMNGKGLRRLSDSHLSLAYDSLTGSVLASPQSVHSCGRGAGTREGPPRGGREGEEDEVLRRWSAERERRVVLEKRNGELCREVRHLKAEVTQARMAMSADTSASADSLQNMHVRADV